MRPQIRKLSKYQKSRPQFTQQQKNHTKVHVYFYYILNFINYKIAYMQIFHQNFNMESKLYRMSLKMTDTRVFRRTFFEVF